MTKNVAIILAGGVGSRFGLDIPKQFAKLAGKTILEHTIEAFQNHELIDEICIVSKKEWISKVDELLINNNFSKVKKVLSGGKERKDSSLSAIKAYEQESQNIKINLVFHDAVRPFVSSKIISECIEALSRYNAVDVAIPATDTIIRVKDDVIVDIPTRSEMMQGQTPQCFTYQTIKTAYDKASKDINFKPTDDCGIVKKYLPNEEVYVVNGSIENIKITYNQDIFTADKIFQLKTHKINNRFSESYYKERLYDKVIVVYGGSYGIGKDIVDIAKEYGARVYSFSRTQTDTDVSRISDIQKTLQSVYDIENRIDFVVNTASILIKEPLQNSSYKSVIDIININYLGAINIIKESIQYLQNTKGSILNFTSSSYTRGRANYALYSSTKAAIVNLTQAMGEELKIKGIKVNCINPERTKTPMRVSNFGIEPEDTLLDSKQVAYSSINTLISNLTGQIVDVKLQNNK